MNIWENEETRLLLEALLCLETPEEGRLFLEDMCTVKEITDMAQRLHLAKLLRGKASYMQINHQTGVSTATISRVSRCLDYGTGGYGLVLDRLEKGAASDG